MTSGATTSRAPRADRERTRLRLLEAMGTLIETHGLDVTLPELAREAGVATATAYRHFDDVQEVRTQFYARLVDTLIQRLSALAQTHAGRQLFDATCRTWVAVSWPWAKAATYIRSPEGYLERVDADDPLVSGLHRVLVRALDSLVAEGIIPAQDLDYGALVWTTMLDERVIVDLAERTGDDAEQIASRLGRTVLSALGARSV